METINIGIYQHYKGNFYKVIGIARHSETHEEMIIYQELYTCEEFGNNPMWARPKQMFLEKVTLNGKEVPRFIYIKPE